MENSLELTKTVFGTLSNGEEIFRYDLKNKDTFYQVSLINYGAHIISFLMPDRDGILEEINLGYKDLESYV
jgi:aldose 1-epimerase